MINNLKLTLYTATLQQSGITFSGAFATGILSALFYILIARVLGPNDFGIFMVAVTTSTMLSDIADIGINTGLVRFVSQYITTDRDKAHRFLKAALEIKILASALLIFTGWFISPWIANVFFAKPELAFSLFLSFVGA